MKTTKKKSFIVILFLLITTPMLAERFNCDNLTVIRALKIKATKDFLRRLEKQKKESFDMLRKAGF